MDNQKGCGRAKTTPMQNLCTLSMQESSDQNERKNVQIKGFL